jgi:hypothetical protein
MDGVRLRPYPPPERRAIHHKPSFFLYPRSLLENIDELFQTTEVVAIFPASHSLDHSCSGWQMISLHLDLEGHRCLGSSPEAERKVLEILMDTTNVGSKRFM